MKARPGAWIVAGLAAAAAACGGGPQVVIEVTGAAPGAERLDVLLLDPVVLAKEQRHNDPARSAQGVTLETVFYMGERARISVDLGGAGTDGFQLEIRDAGGPYVPLVAAVSGAAGTPAEQLLALGVYDPAGIAAAPLGRAYAPSAVSPVSDVSIFGVALEPVDRVLAPAPAAAAPTPVGPREVLRVSCPDAGETSGFAWRRADGAELRVLVPLGGETGAARLDPPDLDCDQHSPGRAGVVRSEAGDQRDCDDTSAIVNADARERCSPVDEDCDPQTTLSLAACTTTCASGVCACDDAGAREVCLAATTSGPCKLPATSSGGSGRLVCDSLGTIKLLGCAAGCEAMLVWAPEGLEVMLRDDPDGAAYGIGKWAPLADATAYLTVHGDHGFLDPVLPVIARIKAAAGTSTVAIPLQPFDAPCGSPSTFECPSL